MNKCLCREKRKRQPTEIKMTASKKAKKTQSKKAAKKNKADYLDNRDLALRIIADGFKAVKKDIGDRLDPVRASKLMALLKDEYGFKDGKIDKELRDLAAEKRRGHFGGPVTPPEDGEEREYTVGSNGRIGTPVKLLGKKPGDKVRVLYGAKQIVIRK